MREYRVWDRSQRIFHWINFLALLGLAGIGTVILNADMRAFRAPIVDIHELNFYLLLALIAIHIASAVFMEFREGGAVISAMFTGSKWHEDEPVDAELAHDKKRSPREVDG